MLATLTSIFSFLWVKNLQNWVMKISEIVNLWKFWLSMYDFKSDISESKIKSPRNWQFQFWLSFIDRVGNTDFWQNSDTLLNWNMGQRFCWELLQVVQEGIEKKEIDFFSPFSNSFCKATNSPFCEIEFSTIMKKTTLRWTFIFVDSVSNFDNFQWLQCAN